MGKFKPAYTYDPKELENGDFIEFVANLPERLHRIAEMDLRHLWKQSQDNARIALNLETRAEELQTVFDALQAVGFTVDDLEAFKRQQSGIPAFGFMTPDYVLPKGYRRADYQNEGDA